MTPIQAALFEWTITQDTLQVIGEAFNYLVTKNADFFKKEIKTEFLGDKNAIAAVVAYLLDHGATASIEHTDDGFGRTALHIAAMYGHDKSITILCKKGAKKEATDIDGATPL